MLSIQCTGTPHQIGIKHGEAAAAAITRCIAFYAKLFLQSTGKDWQQIRDVAGQFEPILASKWPQYLEEIRGIATGASVPVVDIIALNVRTEITFGLWNSSRTASDGCTALAWHTEKSGFLAQNWDWQEEQSSNLLLLTINQPEKPTIKMVTEAGIIGKIGLNSAGVGVCLNAIRIPGLDMNRIPCHLGLRKVLESRSREEAVDGLRECGVASACHFLIADSEGSTGLEWSSTEVQEVKMSERSKLFHTNHYVLPHPGVEDIHWLKDSPPRLSRIEALCDEITTPSLDGIARILQDQQDFPAAICRSQVGESTFATLFSIVMDLAVPRAIVTMGQPVKPTGTYELRFE